MDAELKRELSWFPKIPEEIPLPNQPIWPPAGERGLQEVQAVEEEKDRRGTYTSVRMNEERTSLGWLTLAPDDRS